MFGLALPAKAAEPPAAPVATKAAMPTAPVAPPAATVAPTAPPAAPVAEAPPPPPPPVVEPSNTDQAFSTRTQELQDQVNGLREKVKSTYLRLVGMSGQVLGGDAPTGAKLTLWHRNELGSIYVLVGVLYALDGAPLYTKSDDTGDLNAREEFVIFDSRVIPGPHQLSVEYELRGHGYGIFQYLEGLRLRLRKSFSFNVEAGKVTKVTGTVYEKGEITLEFKDKPDVSFAEDVNKEVVKPPADADDQGGVVPAVAPGGNAGSRK